MGDLARIGGSEAAAAAGVDHFKSRVMLWAEKRGYVERVETAAMAVGTELQPVVAEMLGRRGFEVLPAPADGFTGPHEFMCGHPDGFTLVDGARAVAELKTTSVVEAWKDGHAPASAVLQVLHYLELTGLDVGVLGALVGAHGGFRFEVRIIERDEKLLALLLEREAEFWTLLASDNPPAPDGSDSAGDALKAMFPQENGSAVRLLGEGWSEFRELKARREQLATVKAQVAELEQGLKLRLGDAAVAVSPHDDEVARWTNVERTALDTKALKAARPDVWAEFAKTTTSRRLTLS
jgi:predicted phage-related endonuclease